MDIIYQITYVSKNAQKILKQSLKITNFFVKVVTKQIVQRLL